MQDPHYRGQGQYSLCTLDRVKQCELGTRDGKPVPVELTARDAEENHCQSEQCAQYSHAALKGGDPIAQDVLAYALRVQRDDFPEAPLDPRPRRGRRDIQLVSTEFSPRL